jgi:two-component system chemotaxis response regulator CheB
VAYSVVGIGTSWGGLAAMTKLLGGLPANFSLPVVIVQHRGKDSDRLLSELLQDATDMRVCEAEDKDPLESGSVYVAPANYHVLIDSGYLS